MDQEHSSHQPGQYYCVEAELPLPFRELFLEALWELGTLGAEEIDPEGEVRLLAYFDANMPLEVLRNQVEASLLDMGCGEGRVSFHRLRYDDSAWIEKFNTTFVGFEVSPTFWVYPPWDRPSDRHTVNILLEPGHGFGTGTHESTQMAMEAVAECARDCATMVDYGTGSGILAVAAAKLNPGLRIVAFDVDPLAVNAAAKTLRLNDLDELDLFVGEGGSLKGPFDLVVANLTAAIISSVAADLGRLSGRYLIVAGFTVSEVDFVTSFLLEAGPVAERHRWVRNDWACLLLERCEE